MQAYVITCSIWDGHRDTVDIAGVVSTKEKAVAYCKHMNASRTSYYSPDYDYEEFDLDKGFEID